MNEPTESASEDGQPAARADRVGPVLFCRGLEGGRLALVAVVVVPPDQAPPPLEPADGPPAAATTLLETTRRRVLRYAFSLPVTTGASSYVFDDESYEVATEFGGDLRIAYISCNGEEFGDAGRDRGERNAMWRRLVADHRAAPLQLVLHGGDQLYADEMLTVDPALMQWRRGEGRRDALFDEDLAAAARDYLVERYVDLYRQPAIAWLLARVPSLMMWDDHDICDGWGSLGDAVLDAPIGRGVFTVARECFFVFQLGAAPGEPPPAGADPTGATLSWDLALPGVHIVAPDLRSERRQSRVMGPAGWSALEAGLDRAERGARVLVMSSVPALGPRLSWVERAMLLIPHSQTYEDDLRDQWQSRTHRAEWRAFLERLLAVHGSGRSVSMLSGEIHLATRGEMHGAPRPLHQLVASGIAHRAPPKAYARTLGALARLGESPVRGHPIRMRPLPGQRGIYTTERNYLVLERRAAYWSAYWMLADSGRTPSLSI